MLLLCCALCASCRRVLCVTACVCARALAYRIAAAARASALGVPWPACGAVCVLRGVWRAVRRRNRLGIVLGAVRVCVEEKEIRCLSSFSFGPLPRLRSGSLSSRRGPGTRSAGTGRTSESDPTRPHGRMRMSHVTPSPGDPSPDRTAETRAARPARRGRGWGPVVPQGGDLYAVSLCLRVLKLGHEKQGPRRVIARID
jgi:hypothetical protein